MVHARTLNMTGLLFLLWMLCRYSGAAFAPVRWGCLSFWRTRGSPSQLFSSPWQQRRQRQGFGGSGGSKSLFPPPPPPLLLLSSANPNDLESPEERSARMDLVRRLQKSFYADESGIVRGSDGVFEDVPLWRVQWTELPGYQNILNVHVPHYTHMFMRVLNGPKPWYFGHVFLPGGTENLDNPKYQLRCSGGGEPSPLSEACHTGVLMRVSDYRQLDDGRLLLVVQALGRFEVLEATQHAPYAVATIKLTPDEDLMAAHMDEAMDLAADRGLGVTEARAAARVGAVAEAMRWEPFEFRDVKVEECVGEGIGGASPLANYNAGSAPSGPWDASGVMAEYLDRGRERPMLTAVPAFKSEGRAEHALQIERETWISMDYMLQLLMLCMERVNPDVPGEKQVPVPTQLLGLLPNEDGVNWPEGFKLNSVAEHVASEKSLVGTMSKSPFLAVGQKAGWEYPELRRAQRFSFAIWTLLEAVTVGHDPAAQTRQSVLELESVTERLEAAKRGLDTINEQLRKTLGK